MATTVSLEHWRIEVTESQNGWNWKSSHLVQPSCSEQGKPEQVDRGCSYLPLNTSKDTDSTTCKGRLKCVTKIMRREKLKIKFFSYVWVELCFVLCPLSIVLSLDTIKESLASPIRRDIDILMRFSRATPVGSLPAFSSLGHVTDVPTTSSSPQSCIGLSPEVHFSLVLGGPGLGPKHRYVSSGLSRGEESFFLACWWNFS